MKKERGGKEKRQEVMAVFFFLLERMNKKICRKRVVGNRFRFGSFHNMVQLDWTVQIW